MRRLNLVAAAAAAISVASAFQLAQSPKSPYERRGLYHAAIQGRFVSPSGEPAAGVHVQLNAGRPRPLPLADVVTGVDGRFSISNVDSIYPPYLTWFPPEAWMNGGTSVVGESASTIDVGVIRLRRAETVRIAVELVGGPPLNSDDRGTSVILEGEPGWPRLLAEEIGSEQVIQGIPFENGTWEVTVYAKSGIEVYTAPFHLPRGRRDQKFTLRLLRDTVKPSGGYRSGGQMEVSLSTTPPRTFTREFKVSGRVVAPDGSPVDGAIVSTFGLPPRSWMAQWARTGSDGGFQLTYNLTRCTTPSVTYGDSDYWNLYFSKPNLRDIPCEDWLRTPQTIVMPAASPLSIRVSGLDPSKVRASWWHDSFGWQPFSSLHPWVPAWGLWHAVIRLAADGYLPIARNLEVPYFDPAKADPPRELPMDFQFDPDTRRTLLIRAEGKPLGRATVDVESIVNLASDRRRFLSTYSVPPDGRLQLLGGGDQIVEVFVYAAGFEPQRAIWNPGTPLVVDLAARRTSIAFPASSTVVAARIRVAGAARAVRTIRLHPRRPSLVQVTAGTYDITCYNTTGAVAGYQRLQVAGASTATADCSLDQRPRLTVRRPGPSWRMSVSASMPPGGATQWAAMIPVPGLPGFAEVEATVVRESRTEPVIAMSYAGKWHIEASEGRRALSLWRDIDLEPGASMTIVLPEAMGTLKGSMRTYGGGLEASDHGFAGPRIQLIADDPDGWSVTDYLPERDAREGEERHHFTLARIPVGDYHLYHHLIGEPKSYTFGGRTNPYTKPIAAWGGVPVHIEANTATVLKDFSEYPFGDLKVRVTRAGGHPVEHATLRIRDRMSESWRQAEEDPARLEEAAHPIPYPAAARIVGGKATLPNVRTGWLDLVVESDNGPAFSFTVPVSLEHELSLTIPSEGR